MKRKKCPFLIQSETNPFITTAECALNFTPQMTPAEAWGLVLKAINRSGYQAREEFDKLPPLIQRLVGSPSQLRDWGMMDANTVQSVVASNFQM